MMELEEAVFRLSSEQLLKVILIVVVIVVRLGSILSGKQMMILQVQIILRFLGLPNGNRY